MRGADMEQALTGIVSVQAGALEAGDIGKTIATKGVQGSLTRIEYENSYSFETFDGQSFGRLPVARLTITGEGWHTTVTVQPDELVELS